MIIKRSLEGMRRRNTLLPPPEIAYLGPWRARVMDNTDALGRLRVHIPDVTRDAPHPQLAWPKAALMSGGKTDAGVAYGSLFLPPVGAWVNIEFEDGDANYPMWEQGWFAQGEVPAALSRHLPNRRGLVTPSGHYLWFDDDPGTDADSQTVALGTAQGIKLNLCDVDGKATLVTKNGRKIEIDDTGAAVTITVAGGTVNVDAAHVNLGVGASDPVTKYTELKAAYDAHVHGSAVGPTGPPTVPMPASVGSDVTKTG